MWKPKFMRDPNPILVSAVAEMKAQLSEEKSLSRFWRDEYRRLHRENANLNRKVRHLEKFVPPARVLADEQASTGAKDGAMGELRILVAKP